MQLRATTLGLVAMLGLGFGSVARADLPIDVSNLSGALLEFSGTSTGANVNFATNSSGWGFDVTSNPSQDSNLVGAIGGTFSYLTSNITTIGGLEMVNVTGTGSLTINDNGGSGGNDLTGTINGFSLSYTLGTGGGLNEDATVNLSNVSYSGSNADLKALAADVAQWGGGVVTVSFQFSSPTSLTALTSGTHDTSWSGSITSTPEPSALAVAGLGALGFIGYSLRRRRVCTRGR